MTIINILDSEASGFESWEHGPEYGGATRALAAELGAEKLGFHLETLEARRFSCPYHRHQGEEELFIVLKGRALLRQDGEFKEIKEGDLVFFKTGVAHQFYNHTDSPFIFFALSNRDPADVCEYPDSRKVLNVADRKLTQDGQEVEDYWQDEENPRNFWPQHLVQRRN